MYSKFKSSSSVLRKYSNAFGACLLAAIVFIGCISKKSKTEYYPNGHIKSIISYTNDSIKNGEATFYDSVGHLMKREYYRNDKNDSFTLEYYPNGILKRKVLFFNYSPVSFFEYNDNGTIKAYYAKDFYNELFYLIKYDSLVHKTFEKGYAISSNYGIKGYGRDSGKRKLLYAGDTLNLTFLIAEPPHYDPQVFIWVYKIKCLEDTIYKYCTICKEEYGKIEYDVVRNSAVRYTSVFKEKGTYQIICAAIIRDTTSSFKRTDTVSSVWKVE